MQTIEEKLISECKLQVWIRNTAYKNIEYVDKINPYSIKSVRQRLIKKQ